MSRTLPVRRLQIVGALSLLLLAAAPSWPQGRRTVLRVVTVPTRKAGETILSRIGRDTPLAIGAKGIASVRTLTPEEVKRLPPDVRGPLLELSPGEHSRLIAEKEAYSIYQATTLDFYDQAWALYGKGLKDEALRKVEKDLILNPDHIKGLALIGRIYEDRREFRRAAEAYQQMIGFHPKSAVGYRLMGRVRELEKKWDLAISRYEESLKRDPRQHDVLNNLALLYAKRKGDRKRALALIEKALALKPNTPEYVDTRTVILGKEAARQAKKGPPPVAAKRTDDSKKSKKESLKTAKAEGPPKPAAGPATVVVNDLPPPPELAPPAPRPAEKAKTDGRSPPGSAGAWPPPANPPSDLPPAPPVLVGPSAPKDGRAAADGENPDGEKPRRSRLVVMSPSTREAALKTPRAAQRALRLVKRDGRVSGDGSLRIRIKVLDGTGDISNARRVKRLLESNGFDVKRTGLTDKGTWRRTVLFYKPGFGPQAVRVAKVLPGKPKTRPLTWKSAFDIILVVGRDASGP